MLWPTLTILLLVALLVLQLRWRARFRQAEQAAQREIDRLKQAREQAALQFESRQSALFNSMAEGLLLLDQNHRIQLANRAFHNLFDIPAELRGRTMIEALRLHELADLPESLNAENPVLGLELKLAGPPERWLGVNAAGIFDSGGKRLGTVLVFHDLTRLKQLERARKEFVANVSHELRTPLSLIKGYVETLLDGAKDNPEVAARFLQTIARNSERLRLLIDDLLTISELESGRLKLNLQPINLRTVTEKVVTDLGARAAARQMKLCDTVPDMPVHADPDRIEQVLYNLVDNAIKYGRTDGTVTLSARLSDGNGIEVAVQDDGPGIPTEALDRVFERFYRVDKGRSREQGGTGLGLSIVKHIVQNHGGKAWVASQPGLGATFFFTLPRAE